MSRVILIIVSVSVLFGALARGAGTDPAAEIRAVMTAQVAAWNRGDIDGFMNGYAKSADIEFVSGDKIIRGWQTVRDNYRKKYDSREKMGRLAFSEIKVTQLNASTALVAGQWSLRRKGDRPHGTVVLVFRRLPPSRAWRVVHDETTTAAQR